MKKIIFTERAPAAIGPYSQAVKSNNLFFISGQLGINPENGSIVEGGVEEQMKQIMKNIKEILNVEGLTFDNILKTTIFLTDMNDFAKINAIYEQYFNSNYPARSAIQVVALPKNGLVEVELIAEEKIYN